MTKLHGLMCIRNEADRYLTNVLEWHTRFLDGIFVYDDRSDDNSVELARAVDDVTVAVRPERATSFAEHEGKFRAGAWAAFETTVHPNSDDWILAIDADEFFVAQAESERDALERLARNAEVEEHALAWALRVDEIFDVVGNVPRRRIDGSWSKLHAVRFFRYRPNGRRFANRQLGCGSAPTYALTRPIDGRDGPVSIHHYGYLRPDDREAKYQRLSTTLHNGHDLRHVESIRSQPTLESLRSSTCLV